MKKKLDTYSQNSILKSKKRLLIDADLILQFFLKYHPNLLEIEKIFLVFEKLDYQIFITSFAVNKIHFYLGIEDPQNAENALIWLEQNLNIQVVNIDSSVINILGEYSIENIDFLVEEIAINQDNLDAVITLHPERYINLSVPILSITEVSVNSVTKILKKTKNKFSESTVAKVLGGKKNRFSGSASKNKDSHLSKHLSFSFFSKLKYKKYLPNYFNWQKVLGTAVTLLILLGSPLLRRPLALASNRLGIKQHKQGQLYQAQNFYNIAILLQKDLGSPYYNLGWLHDRNLADSAQAFQWYQEAAQRGLPKAHAEVARLRISQEDYAGALKSIYQCLQLTQYDAVKASCMKNRAWIRLEQDRLKEAEKDVYNALKLKEESPHAYCLLAQILERQGHPEKAHQHWKKVQQYSRYNVPEEDQCLGLAEHILSNLNKDY